MSTDETLYVPHIIAGRLCEDYEVEYRSGGTSFMTPKLDLDGLVHPRGELPPAYNLPVSEIIDFLVAVGERLDFDKNNWLAKSVEATANSNPLDRRVVENIFRDIATFFRRDVLEFEVEQTLGGPELLDTWREVVDFTGRKVRVRAFPPRLVHILAGNSPGVAAMSITRSALSKGVCVLKLASNDLFTASAILRTMTEVDPHHPVVRSISAVYWRGGDASVEQVLYRPQYCDKIVVWGGDSAINNVIKYLGPGIQMVAFDPKVSTSMIGREAHVSEETQRKVAELSAIDIQLLDQEACAAPRFQYVEGSAEEIDRYCEFLNEALHQDRKYGSACAAPPSPAVISEVEALRMFEPIYKVWGDTEGGGAVIRSPEPVTFHPIGKIVNIIPVNSLQDAVVFANPATQTVGVWPPERKAEVRDYLCAAGVQRVVALGGANDMLPGLPHDGFLPLHRFMNWVADEG